MERGTPGFLVMKPTFQHSHHLIDRWRGDEEVPPGIRFSGRPTEAVDVFLDEGQVPLRQAVRSTTFDLPCAAILFAILSADLVCDGAHGVLFQLFHTKVNRQEAATDIGVSELLGQLLDNCFLGQQ